MVYWQFWIKWSYIFKVSDYEVFGIDYEKRDNINKLWKRPNVIWEYIKTKDISEESLATFDDDIDLLSDLDAIHCKDDAIQLKISRYYLKNPSILLPNSQIVDQKYDEVMENWIGSYTWKLIYRASEHEYRFDSFHDYCNDARAPTFVVIKSSGGWIFGGYTSDRGRIRMTIVYNHIYSLFLRKFTYDCKAFIFTLKNAHDRCPTR